MTGTLSGTAQLLLCAIIADSLSRGGIRPIISHAETLDRSRAGLAYAAEEPVRHTKRG
jgi:hypothetical protein